MGDKTPENGGFWPGAGGGVLMAVTAMFCVQLGVALAVGLFDRIGTLGTAALRMGCASVVLLLVVRPWRERFTRTGFRACLVLGVITGGMMVLFMLAVARIHLGTASALEFLGPLCIALVGEKGKRKWWAVSAAAGVLLLTEPWSGDVDMIGIAFAISAAVCWAGYILMTQRVGDEVTGLRGLAVSMAVAGLFATLVAAPVDLGRITWPVLLIGFGLALLHPVLAFSLEFLALRRLTTSAFGILMSLEPGVACVIGFLALQQVPGVGPAAGVVLVTIASIAVTRRGGRGQAPEQSLPQKSIS
jgi:inner membrane transporter RhtA